MRSRPLLSTALLVISLWGWSACEPLDLALFPVTSDASVPPPIDIPTLPATNGPRDAGRDATGSTPPAPCVPGAALCEACVLRAECPAGDVCHPRTGECVPPCASGSPQCPAGLVCNSLDVCVECIDDVQCRRPDDDQRCEPQRGVCVECFNDDHCTDDPLERPACLATGICGCASNDDCSGAQCELDEGHCDIEGD